MTKRRLILAIAIWILAATLVFVLWRCASAQRRRVEPSLYLDFPMLAVPPPMDIANHGNVWFDPNGDFLFRDHEGNINYLGDVSVLNSPNLIPPVGIDQNAPIDECYVQLSDKLVICREFTSAGINACIDAVGTAGEVICPEGTYSITEPVFIDTNNITIRGVGAGTIWQLDANNIYMLQIKNAGVGDIYGIRVSGITFNGNSENYYVDANCAMVYMYSIGLGQAYDMIYINNCVFKNFGNYAIKTYPTAFPYMSCGYNIIDCQFIGNEDASTVGIYNASEMNIYGCTFSYCGNAIYNDEGHVDISECQFHYTKSHAINSIGIKTIITGCHFYCTEGRDINLVTGGVVDNYDYTMISGNLISDTLSTDYSIYAEADGSYCPVVLITGNYFVHIYAYMISDIPDTISDIYVNAPYAQITSNNFTKSLSPNNIRLGYYGPGCMVNDNLFHSNSYSLYVDSYENIISGNKFLDPNNTHDLYLDDDADYNLITANIFGDSIFVATGAAHNGIYGNDNTDIVCQTTCAYDDFDVAGDIIVGGDAAIGGNLGIAVDSVPTFEYFRISDKYIVCGEFNEYAINCCIDELGSEGGTIFLPEGVYTVNYDAVNLTCDNITLQGAGPGTILMLSGDHHGIYAADEIDGIRIYDLTIDANGEAAATSSLIHILGSEDTIIRGVEFKNFLGNALTLYTDTASTDYGLIDSCTFGPAADDSSYAVYAYANGASAWGTIDVTHCKFIDCDVGVKYTARNTMSINYCNFSGCMGYAIDGAGEDASIVCNLFDSCESRNINLTSANSSRIFNNTFWNAGDSEIYAASTSNLVITSNAISESNNIATGNIYLNSVTSASITANVFDLDPNDADYNLCINLVGSSVIANNLFSANVDTSAVYFSNAVGNICYGNRNFSQTGTVLSNGELDIAAIPKFRAESLSNGYLKLWPYQNDAIADDGTVNLPDATDGTLIVSITDPNSSFTDECALFMVTSAGEVTKVSGTANTDAADTDGDLCVYDGGTYAVIRNRMGDVGIMRAFYFYQ